MRHFHRVFLVEQVVGLRSTIITILESVQRVKFLSTYLPTLHFDIPEQDVAEKGSFEQFCDHVLTSGQWKSTIMLSGLEACSMASMSLLCFVPSHENFNVSLAITSVGACSAIIHAWSATFVRPKLAGLLVGVCTVFYCICRRYLVVEGFVGLRSVPEALYRYAVCSVGKCFTWSLISAKMGTWNLRL